MQQVKLTYTPIGGSSTDLTIDVIAVHGAAEPDALELFPGLKHSFLDGSLSEQIAGARRNIEIDFGPKVSAANRRHLVNFWLSETKTLTCLCATPTLLNVSYGSSPTGGLSPGVTYYYKIVAIDAVGFSIASNELNIVGSGTYKNVDIAWSAVANARGYKIFRKNAAERGGAYGFLDYCLTNSYNDANAIAEVVGTPPVAVSTISVVNASNGFSINWLNDFEGGRNVRMTLVESSVFTTFPV